MAAAYSSEELESPLAWERYGRKGEEFSVALPSCPFAATFTRPIYYPKPAFERIYGTYNDGVVYVIASLDNPGPQISFDTIISEFRSYPMFRAGFTFEHDLHLDGFDGKQYSVNSDAATGAVQFYLTSQHVYISEAVSDYAIASGLSQFFSSITLGAKARTTEIPDDDCGETYPLTKASHKLLAEYGAILRAAGASIVSSKEATRAAVIVTRPEPEYTDAARLHQRMGAVLLRGVLAASGEVTDVQVVHSLPDGLTQQAIRAVHRIKFLPAVKDGKPVSQYFQVEFNFNLY